MYLIEVGSSILGRLEEGSSVDRVLTIPGSDFALFDARYREGDFSLYSGGEGCRCEIDMPHEWGIVLEYSWYPIELDHERFEDDIFERFERYFSGDSPLEGYELLGELQGDFCFFRKESEHMREII